MGKGENILRFQNNWDTVFSGLNLIVNPRFSFLNSLARFRDKHPAWLPVVWLGISGLLLALDFVTGPFVGFPIVFVIPVGLAACYSGRKWGITLAVFLPLARFGFIFWWSEPWSLRISILNLAIRLAVLLGTALLVDRVVRQAAEINILRGILPTCCVCKKIRNKDERWVPIEVYITKHSEAQFSHTFCPECGKEHYGDFWPKESLAHPKSLSTVTTSH